ncbi:MAG: hypothetical protein U1F77_01595 [Kiritimatiellia bacterium]
MRELFELREGEAAMGLERSETAAVFVLEIGGDQVEQAGIGGVVDASEQFAAQAQVELGGGELVEPSSTTAERLPDCRAMPRSRAGSVKVGVEPVGGGGAGVLGVRGVVEEEPVAADQLVDRAPGILRP